MGTPPCPALPVHRAAPRTSPARALGRTWRAPLRSAGRRRPRSVTIRLRWLFSPRSLSARLPPPPSDPPPPPDDPAAAVAYLLRLAPFVVRRLQRLGVPNRDVEDVAQRVLIVAHRSWERFEAPSDVLEGVARRRWVFGITWRCALGYRRSTARHLVLLADADDPRLDPRDVDAPDLDQRLDAERSLYALTESRLATPARCAHRRSPAGLPARLDARCGAPATVASASRPAPRPTCNHRTRLSTRPETHVQPSHPPLGPPLDPPATVASASRPALGPTCNRRIRFSARP